MSVVIRDSPYKLRAFLCHATEDKATVRHLCRELKQKGFDPWFDEERLLPGQEWRDVIQSELRSSDVVVVLISKHSVAKDGFVQKEIKQALDVADEKHEGSIFIIPARLDEATVPSRLSHVQWVNLFDSDGLLRLCRALEHRAGQLRAQPLQVSASSGLHNAQLSAQPPQVSAPSELQNAMSEPTIFGRLWRLADLGHPSRVANVQSELTKWETYHSDAFHDWLVLSIHQQREDFELFIRAAPDIQIFLEYLKDGRHTMLIPRGVSRAQRADFEGHFEVLLEWLSWTLPESAPRPPEGAD